MVSIMNETERRRILDEARQTVERTASINAAEWSPRDPSAPDVLEQWRSNMPKAEPPQRQRGLDTAPIDWSSVIDQRLGNMKHCVLEVVGQALHESFDIERSAYAAALEKRDAKINKMECELVRAQAEIAKLNLRVVEMSIEHDRERERVLDLPPLPKNKGLN
jgi:hypothetical protein